MSTPTFGWPFPTLGDVPNVPADIQALAEAVDTDVAAIGAAPYGRIEYGQQTLTALGRLTVAQTVAAGGTITHDGSGRLTLPDGVYTAMAAVACGTGPAWVRGWIRTDGGSSSVRLPLAAVTAAGGGSAGGGTIVVAGAAVSVGLWVELPGASSLTVSGGGQTYLHIARIGNRP